MRVLAIAAHPDDIEYLCAGTLARFEQQGADIFVSNLCNGDKGHYDIKPPELAQIRKEEAEKSARILGAEIQGGFFGDLDIFVDRESLKKVVELIRVARPDLIITLSPDDYMADHTVTSKLVINASFAATVPNYVTDHTFHSIIPPIVFMDTIAGLQFNPTEYVDITSVIETKEKMLLCHQSQAKWLKEHDNIDYIEQMRRLASFRGQQCGVKYAEAFQVYQVWGRTKPERLLP